MSQRKSKGSSGSSGNYNHRDAWFLKAKKDGFAARSVYKLEEIDQKFRVLRAGEQVLDLGAAPGSWSQYASKKIGSSGRLVGIDLTPITLKLPNAHFIASDLREIDLKALCAELGLAQEFDVIISDMAPKTTGIKSTDQARSLELCELALSVAEKHLKTGGHFVCKFFHSADFSALRDRMKKLFTKIEALKPDSTRKESKEIFMIGFHRKSEVL